MQGAWGDVGGSLSAELGFLGDRPPLDLFLSSLSFFHLMDFTVSLLCVRLYHDVGGGAHATAYVWRSGGNLTELVP